MDSFPCFIIYLSLILASHPPLLQVIMLSIFICCVRHGFSLPDDKPNGRNLQKFTNTVRGSRVLLSLSPRGEESDSKEPPFDYQYQIKREKDGETVICGRTVCPPGTEVKPCEDNYGEDTCIACPPGKHMLDSTRSEAYVLHCVDIPSCHDWPGTIETIELRRCAGGFRMKCRCNTEDGKCGEDPCHCKKRSCAEGEILQQNCSCELVVENRTYRHTSKPEETVRRSSPQSTPDKEDPMIRNKTSETTQMPFLRFPKRHQTRVIFPGPFRNTRTKGKHWPGSDDWKTIVTSVAIMSLLMILLFCCMVWTCFRKKSKKFYTESRFRFNDVIRGLRDQLRKLW